MNFYAGICCQSGLFLPCMFQASYLTVAEWVVSAWASVSEEVVHRSFSASGLIASDNWQEGVHSRLREKILPDEPVVMSSDESDSEELLLEEGTEGLFFDSDSGEKSDFLTHIIDLKKLTFIKSHTMSFLETMDYYFCFS